MNPRMIELLDRYLDGALSPEDAAELEAMLSASDEARAEFWKRARLHSALRIVAQERRGKKMAGESQAQPRVVATRPRVVARTGVRRTTVPHRETSRRAWWIPLTAAAALAIAAVVSWKSFFPSRTPSPAKIAVLTRAADAVWADANFAPQPGRALPAGMLRLRAGAVQVEFSRGARVVIEGPAEFQLVSENEGRLGFGKLWAQVPPAAHGFTVRTRDFNVVDLGTEFGCSIPPAGPAELHVFDGEVELRKAAGTRPVRENEALQIGDTGSREIPALRGDFLGEEQMPQVTAFLRGSRTEQDIGSPGQRGSTSLDSRTGVWTVAGGGADIYGASDQFHFVSQEFAADGTFIAKVTAVEKTDAYSKAGVMLRDSMRPDSPYALVFVGPSTVGFEFRTATGRDSSHAPYATGPTPRWVKLVRAGNSIAAYYGGDGVRWKQLGNAQSIPMSSSSRAGLAVTAHNNAALNRSTFENVSAQP